MTFPDGNGSANYEGIRGNDNRGYTVKQAYEDGELIRVSVSF